MKNQVGNCQAKYPTAILLFPTTLICSIRFTEIEIRRSRVKTQIKKLGSLLIYATYEFLSWQRDWIISRLF
jgi:hypothetical protein